MEDIHIKQRKQDHIDICTSQNVEPHSSPFWDIHLPYTPIPEIDFNEVDLSTHFLGKTFNLPLFISGMTGGTEEAFNINKNLAQIAAESNIPLGLGSMKIALKHPETLKTFQLKKMYPELFLMGNLSGNIFNYGYSLKEVLNLINQCQLDAFVFHLNPLQESIQPEGEKNFKKVLYNLKQLKNEIPIPLIIKEVGTGIPSEAVKKLYQAGIKHIDVGGLGGTSWTYIEGQRFSSQRKRMAEVFKNMGIPTDKALKQAIINMKKQQDIEIYATGGIRDGHQIAKAIFMGATATGMALPFLQIIKKYEHPQKELKKEVEFISESLKIALFCTGHKTPQSLKGLYFTT